MPEPDAPGNVFPPLIAQAWGLTEESQRGPKPELTLDAIVDAGVRVADEEGLEAVTMARIASEVGFTTMSLYRHVASKDDLLQLMSDAAGRGLTVPNEEESASLTWREVLAEWAREGRRHYLRHPWILDVPVAGVPSMPNAVRFADWAVRGMRDLPISDGERISLLLTLSALASSFARIDVQLMNAIDEHGADDALGAGLDRAMAHLITADEFPDLNRLVSAGAYFGGDVGDTGGGEGSLGVVHLEFEYAVSLVLDGLALTLGESIPPQS